MTKLFRVPVCFHHFVLDKRCDRTLSKLEAEAEKDWAEFVIRKLNQPYDTSLRSK